MDWQDPFHRDMIHYLENDRVRGVLLWNGWDQVENARALIAETGSFKAADRSMVVYSVLTKRTGENHEHP